jgi:HK97 family phage portal protein
MGVLNFFNRSKPDQVIPTRRTFGSSGGTVVTEDTAMEASAFYRGVMYISSQIAKLPWEVKNAKNEILFEDNISYLLNVAPNEEMTAMFLKLFLIQCAIVGGNGYAEIERTVDGRVKALHPLNPKRVSPVRDEDGTLWYQVFNGGLKGETVYLRPKDIFIVKNLHTKDAIQGQGVVGYALQTLGISIGADRFANSLFTNGGLPSGVLTHTGKLSPEAHARITTSWKENQGGKKTGGTALLEEGLTYSPISHAPDVMQFLESRKFNVVEIARFLGIPPTKLFDSDSAKFNNIEHANLEVATDTIDAWARNLESEADMKLLSGRKGGRRTELDLYAVFRGDMLTRSTYFKNMMGSGAMTPNEIREQEGMAGYKGGDRFFIATNNFTPEDRMDEVIDAQILSKQPQEPKAPAQGTEADKAAAEYLRSKT